MGAVMLPIPLSLLPSSMAVRVPVDSDYGGEYAEPVEVAHVRFDSSAVLSRRGYVLSDGSKGLVYADAVNSMGAFDMPVGSLVSIDGADEMSVKRVTPCKGFFGVMHHWEIEVA